MRNLSIPKKIVVSAVAVAVGLTLGVAYAMWSADGSGAGPVRVALEALPGAEPPTGSAIGRNVALSWPVVELSTGTPVAGYEVRLYDRAGVQAATLTGCDGVVITPACTEVGVPPGTWRYTVVSRSGQWRGAESVASSTITVGTTSLGFTSSTTITALPATLAGAVSGFLSHEGLSPSPGSPAAPARRDRTSTSRPTTPPPPSPAP